MVKIYDSFSFLNDNAWEPLKIYWNQGLFENKALVTQLSFA